MTSIIYNDGYDVSTTEYNVVDSLEDKFNINDDEKYDLNRFFQNYAGYYNELLDLLNLIYNKITDNFVGNFRITLELSEGDYFHDSLLAIKVYSTNFEDSFRLDEISESIYETFDKDEVDKTILVMEF